MAKRKTKSLADFLPRRKEARFIVQLFAEGETEVQYLMDIARGRDVRVNHVCVVSSPVLLLSRAFRWVVENASMLRKDGGRNRIWVIFDDDDKVVDMNAVAEMWAKCPELCMKECKIRDRNRCRYNDLFQRIKIGYVKPCIELWALMCMDGVKGSVSDEKYPVDRHEIQSILHKRMRTYVHDGHPYFDVAKMTGWFEACKQADLWSKSYAGFPDCLNATRYAGIYPLVKEIYGQV